MFLATAPCCSDDNYNDEIKTEYADNHSQDHKDSDCTTCSPFFTCGSCSGFVFTREWIDFKEVSFIKGKLCAVYKTQFADDFFVKIWQPPKIS